MSEYYSVTLPITFENDANCVILSFGDGSIKMRFDSPEFTLKFVNLLMEKAAEMWPDDEYIKDYLAF